jgi:iron(III) transport system substrate-binding protein
MNTDRWAAALTVLLVVIAAACAPAAPSAPTVASGSDLSAWEKETLQAALTEGKVVVYGFWNPSLEQVATGFMARRYPGLKLETLTSTTAAEKIRTEAQTGQTVADVYLGGQTTAYQLAQLGLSEAFKPPAETAPDAKWVVPPTGYASYPQVAYALLGKGILINSQLVPPAREPKTWKDLLDPFWAGKKVVVDQPSRGGGPGGSWARWAFEDRDLGRSFLEGLKSQDIVLDSGSATPQINAVARGEYYAYVPAFPSYLAQAPGAPLKFIWPQPVTGGGSLSIVSLLKNAPHPNAAKLFINMTLLPEFQALIARELWSSPNLMGVPVPDPVVSLDGRKVLVDTEEDTRKTADWANTIGREIFGN